MHLPLTLGTLSAALLPLTLSAQKADRPNVILLVADDLGYGDLSCYGAERVSTPHTDGLARTGIRFTDVHAVAATSTPSRFSLLTGEYAWRKKGREVASGDAAMIIEPDCFTLADLFKSLGYATAAVGKWHLGLGSVTGAQDWNAPLPQALGDIGFDYSYIMAATADRVPAVFIENGSVANYDPSAPIEVDYRKPFPGEPTGKDNPELLYNLKSSHGHDQAIVNGIGRIGYMKGGGTALWKDENIADSIAVHATRFIEKHAGEPFFLYLATNDIHVPRFPHERFRGRSPMGLRGEAILQFDWTVGQVLSKLEELGIRDNTLIILTSDNGPVIDDGYQDGARELLGGHRPSGPLRGFKYSAYEGGTAVPFIVSWPAVVRSRGTSGALLSQVDLMRSLGSLLGARFPRGSAPDSRDFHEALLGKDGEGAPFVIESSNTLSIRDRKWKYIAPGGGGPMITWGPEIETGYRPYPQLFDLSDKREAENRIETHRAEYLRLRDLLERVVDGRYLQ